MKTIGSLNVLQNTWNQPTNGFFVSEIFPKFWTGETMVGGSLWFWNIFEEPEQVVVGFFKNFQELLHNHTGAIVVWFLFKMVHWLCIGRFEVCAQFVGIFLEVEMGTLFIGG